jgi:hypothetical protein
MGRIRGGDCGRLCAIAVASCLGVISGGLDRECSTQLYTITTIASTSSSIKYYRSIYHLICTLVRCDISLIDRSCV